MIKLTIYMLIILMANNVYANEWTKSDSTLQVTYSLLHVVDWRQTLEITDSNEYKEANIFLGSRPSKDEINLYMYVKNNSIITSFLFHFSSSP